MNYWKNNTVDRRGVYGKYKLLMVPGKAKIATVLKTNQGS